MKCNRLVTIGGCVINCACITGLCDRQSLAAVRFRNDLAVDGNEGEQPGDSQIQRWGNWSGGFVAGGLGKFQDRCRIDCSSEIF